MTSNFSKILISFLFMAMIFSRESIGLDPSEEQLSILRSVRSEIDTQYVTLLDHNCDPLKLITTHLPSSVFPILPPSYRWEQTPTKTVPLWSLTKHREAPLVDIDLHPFYEAEKPLSYVVQFDQRTVYSFAHTRPKADTFQGERRQLIFSKGDTQYWDGHCVDHADSRNYYLRHYGTSSHHPANRVPEISTWGSIRNHLVRSIRSIGRCYSQFVYYSPIPEYTDQGPVIPGGVLFFEHESSSSSPPYSIAAGWQIPWFHTKDNFKNARGSRMRLANHILKSMNNEPIYGPRAGPRSLSYIKGMLGKDFEDRLNHPPPYQYFDPLTQYRLEVLADQEILPNYSVSLFQNHLFGTDVSQIMLEYWGNRAWEHVALLNSFTLDSQGRNLIMQDESLLPQLIKEIHNSSVFDLNHEHEDRWRSIQRERADAGMAFLLKFGRGLFDDVEEKIPEIKEEKLPEIVIPLASGKSSTNGLQILSPTQLRSPVKLKFNITGTSQLSVSRKVSAFFRRNTLDFTNVQKVTIVGNAQYLGGKGRKTLMEKFNNAAWEENEAG